MEKIELLQKIQALAERGVGGESVSAEKKLKQLMQKYGVSDDELADEKTILQDYRYYSKEEKQLIAQIACKVVNVRGGIFYSRLDRETNRKMTVLAVEATKAQHIEIEFLFDFYKKEWEKERELFFRAFISKNELHSNLPPDDKTERLTEEQRHKLNMMMFGIEKSNPIKRLEESK